MGLIFSKIKIKTKLILIIIGFLWTFNGLFLFTFYSAKSLLFSYSISGALFSLQGILLLYHSQQENNISIKFEKTIIDFMGIIFIFFAVFIYPITGNLSGHFFPSAPVFPEPCPLTIVTFGVFFLARKKVPISLMAIPLIWSIVGIIGFIEYGVVADLAEAIIGAFSIVLILIRNRRIGSKSRESV
ncbi:MAG: hypothetical protein JEZ04_12495 [Spirochaetales bacterium]|nr:hypothetical protein [Spirochaetales bacterium]